MRKYLLAAALAGAACTPAAASNITYDSYSFTGIGSIHITSPNDITGGAGPITLYDKGAVVVADAWCMDVNNYLANSGFVGVAPFNLANADSGLPGVPSTLSNNQLKVIGWLIDNGDKATDSTLQGAFQVAIWSEEYGSSFKYDSLGLNFDTDVGNDLSLALSEAQTQGFAPLKISFLVPGLDVSSQTLAFGSPVPEPSTWAMGIIGFAVMGAFGWKRRSTAQRAALSQA